MRQVDSRVMSESVQALHTEMLNRLDTKVDKVLDNHSDLKAEVRSFVADTSTRIDAVCDRVSASDARITALEGWVVWASRAAIPVALSIVIALVGALSGCHSKASEITQEVGP